MKRETDKKTGNSPRGQAALILILLAAAALIFLAITLNWGRIAQTKALITGAAEQSASLMASEAASYGEMQKQTYLQNTNKYSHSNFSLFSLFLIFVAVIVVIASGGLGAPVLAFVSLGLAIGSFAIQALVILPGIEELWNKQEKNQPDQQQFFEAGIQTALQGSVGDQANVTDYFDWNANGVYGNNKFGFPNDTVSRFAVFYSDRLKMLNQPPIPQVEFFYDQVAALMNGETCAQMAIDNKLYPASVPLLYVCSAANLGVNCLTNPLAGVCQDVNVLNETCADNILDNDTYGALAPVNMNCSACQANPGDPSCQLPVLVSLPLNDSCAPNSNPATPTYNPYCDPCCQQLSVPNPNYCAPGSPGCTYNPLYPNPTISVRPTYCPSDTSAFGAPAQCWTNNPFGPSPNPYTLLYDPVYQNNYAGGSSFLEQFGRDQQAPLPGEPPFYPLTLQGNFPSGIYPVFYMFKDFSPEVDTINSTALLPTQIHWCAGAVGSPPSYLPLNAPTLAAFPYLGQLTLPYSCSGQDCCVNYLPESLTGGVPTPPSGGAPSWVIDTVNIPNLVLDPSVAPPFGEGGVGSWLPGDNQFCSTTPPYVPYNGAQNNIPDGMCEWTNNAALTPRPSPPLTEPPSTVDSLDDTMHTLSDFAAFAQTFLSKDIWTLSSTFNSWYQSAAVWIDPAYGGRLLPLPAILNSWAGDIFSWRYNTYATNPSAWCVPPTDASLFVSGVPTNEYNFIFAGNENFPGWGSLPEVIACLSYNAGVNTLGPEGYYQACLNALPPPACPATTTSCPATLPAACAPTVLGRSLLSTPAPAFVQSTPTAGGASTSCDTGTRSSYAWWMQNMTTQFSSCLTELDSGCSSAVVPPDCPDPSAAAQSGPPDTTGTVPPFTCGSSSAYGSWINQMLTNGNACLGAMTDPSCACAPSQCSLSLIPNFHLAVAPTVGQAAGSQPGFSASTVISGCDPTTPGTFANWVQTSLTLFSDEQPKFLLRLNFLNALWSGATTAQALASAEANELSQFLAPCAGTNCSAGGPAAQLVWAHANPQPPAVLPNAVIYGWVDNTYLNGQPGHAHIVKVTAYSPGRCGGICNPNFIDSLLPWITTWTSGFLGTTTNYSLVDRDAFVYVSVKRWDEDHSPVLFPNGHTLWQFFQHNPSGGLAANTAGQGLPSPCVGPGGFGFGLMPQTITGLASLASSSDQTALSNAFMLNDEGNGNVDPSAISSGYHDCLAEANELLTNAPESHICAEYVASSPASDAGSVQSGHSQDSDADYSLKFVNCPSIPPEDLGSS